MSRSHRRFPLSCFVGGESQAEWKRSYNRLLRRISRQRAATGWGEDDLLFPTLDGIADPWDSPRDGSGHYAPFHPDDDWWSRDARVPARFAHYKATRMK